MACTLMIYRSLEDFSVFASLFSDVLLLRLFDVAKDACYAEDKIKYNGVRSLGCLLRYTQPLTLSQSDIHELSVN